MSTLAAHGYNLRNRNGPSPSGGHNEMEDVNLNDNDSRSPSSVHVDLSSHVESYVPSRSKLRNLPGGRILARNRGRIVCFLVAVLVLSTMFVITLFMYFMVRLLAHRASGLEISDIEAAQGNSKLITHSDVRVINLLEPIAPVSDVSHVLVMLDDPLYNSNTLVSSNITDGYLSWQPSLEHARVNFTLAHTHSLAKQLANSKNLECVCYARFGLPYNIVYLSARDATLYEPKVLREYPQISVTTRRFCPLLPLYNEARRRIAERDHTTQPIALTDSQTAPSRALVGFLDSHGYQNREIMANCDLSCVRYCLRFFE